jgi:hypothetical protein
MPPPASATATTAISGHGAPFDGGSATGVGAARFRFFFEPIRQILSPGVPDNAGWKSNEVNDLL